MSNENTPRPDWDFVLPLVYQEQGDAYTHIVRDSLGRMVTHMDQDSSGRTERMACRIVQRVNSHDAMLAALRSVLREFGGKHVNATMRAARAAIASAEQQSPSPSTAGDTNV